MKIKSLVSIILLILSVFTLESCVAREKYTQPQNVVNENLFRTDLIAQDSLGLGSISWREIFTDPILQQHIDKALQNNLDVRMAVQNIVSAEAHLKQSKAAYLPTISIGPNYTFSTQSLNTQFGQMIGARRYVNQFDITGAINWEIDILGKMGAQERAEYANYLSSVSGHQLIKSNLVSAVASAYYQLLTFDEQKRIIAETIVVRNKNLETTKALKNAGIVTEVAVQQSEALVYNAKSMLVGIEVQIELLENAMSLMLGVESGKISRNNLNTQKFPESFHLGFPAQILSNRPDVRVAEFNLRNAFELTNVAKSQFYPSLRISGNAGVQSVDIEKLFSVNSLFASVASGLTQPIFNKRQIKTQYEVSLAQKEKALLNFKKSILNAGKEVSDALKTFTSQEEFINLKNQELAAYDKAVNYSEELVNYGMANYLEVLNANVNKLNTELSISNAKFTKMNAGIELYKALGGGWK